MEVGNFANDNECSPWTTFNFAQNHIYDHTEILQSQVKDDSGCDQSLEALLCLNFMAYLDSSQSVDIQVNNSLVLLKSFFYKFINTPEAFLLKSEDIKFIKSLGAAIGLDVLTKSGPWFDYVKALHPLDPIASADEIVHQLRWLMSLQVRNFVTTTRDRLKVVSGS